MVNRRGIVLIFAMLMMLVLSALLASFYFCTIGEQQQAAQYVNSMRAFWLAEAGLATVKANPGLGGASGSLGGSGYNFNVPAPVVVAGTNNEYWVVTSTGTVSLPNGSNISRTLVSTLKTAAADTSKFPYAIDTTTDLIIKGSVEINGTTQQNDNTINFSNMFGITKTAMRAGSSHLYTETNFNTPVDGITWVDVASGSTLDVAGDLGGSGILIVNGDVHISGTVTFDGIIYVIGALTMTGTVTVNGSVIAESSATADTTLKGNVTLNYNLAQVQGALTNVQFLNKQIVAWQEV